MKKLVFATGNKDKMREIREIMADCPVEIVSMKEAGIVADIVEDGSTFEENAIIKAKAVYDITGLPVIADDSGLCVEALDGRPGVDSARYAPKGMECEKLLKEMEYLMRVSEEREEERFKNLDESIRACQRENQGKAEAAASLTVFPFFRLKKKKFGRNGNKL